MYEAEERVPIGVVSKKAVAERRTAHSDDLNKRKPAAKLVKLCNMSMISWEVILDIT